MKSRSLVFHEALSHDLRAAQDFYATWQSNGSAAITKRIEARLKTIAQNPELFPESYRNIRRALIPRSYYGLFYRIQPDQIQVLALTDLRRAPAELSALLRARRRPSPR